MKQLRILQVCSADSAGGGERHVSDLTLALIERGHQLHLAVRSKSPLREMCAGYDIHWHELPLRNAADFPSARRLAQLAIANGITTMHGHVARDYPVCGLAARMTRAKLFLTRHHYRPFARSLLYQWAISPVQNLIAVSASVAKDLAASFPSLAGRIVVIPNWIDASKVATIPREESRRLLGLRRPLAVGIIGQLSSIKRQDLFLRAAARVKAAGGNDVDFLVVGEATVNNRQYREHLEQLVAELDLASQVHFAGNVRGFANYLHGLDVVVAPSVNEGFSLVVIESMAAGLPVIASRAGGPAEILKDRVTGVLVPTDDLDALVRAMIEMVRNPEFRRRLGEAAAIDARQRFDREHIVSRIEALYLGESPI
ncbi:MAG: glycosyltransferase family 4 protein [Acidobacteriota bacterium]